MVQILIDAGATADPQANDPWGSPMLGQSLQHNGNLALKFLASNVYTTRWHEDFNWILYNAEAQGYRKVDKILVSRLKAIVKEVQIPAQAPPIESYHELSVLAACICDLPDLIAPLAKHGASLNVRHASEDKHDTALLIATKRHIARVVQVLLELGADPNISDGVGCFPIHVAVSDRHDEILHMLLKSGANPSLADGAQRSPLHRAIMYGTDTIIRLLLDHGSDVDASDTSGRRPLVMAASLGRDSSVRLLLDYAADTHAVDKYNNSVLVVAARLGNLKIIDMLLEAGHPLQTEQLDKAASQALHHEQDIVVERLVEEGARRHALPLIDWWTADSDEVAGDMRPPLPGESTDWSTTASDQSQ